MMLPPSVTGFFAFLGLVLLFILIVDTLLPAWNKNDDDDDHDGPTPA